MTTDLLVRALALAGLGWPLILLVLLGMATLVNRPLPERWTGKLSALAMTLSLLCFAASWAALRTAGSARVVSSYGDWFSAGEAEFSVELIFDDLSLLFAVVTSAVAGIVAAFSHRYLHREPGYNRYFVLFAAFVSGMLVVVLAGSIEVLFAGWEILGLSSALLVGFFHERPQPVKNALRVFAVYRISDAALLTAALIAHHSLGRGSLMLLFGTDAPAGAVLTSAEVASIAVFLGIAAAAKCGQLPFSGWLPRAMEGPTPSSAVYYGALSVHAGVFLLLRAAPIFERSWEASLMLGAMGVCTALLATLMGRVQTDVKSALAFAVLTQVSIILVEVALGLYLVATVHTVGHIFLRLLQFLRAPSLLHDFHNVQNAVGGHLGRTGVHFERMVSPRLKWWLYRFALERGYLDTLLDRLLVAPLLALAGRIDRAERSWCDLLAGPRQKGADRS